MLSILLAGVMLFIAWGKTFIVLNYEINKKEITETRCENKDKPEMECNGHCYLSKQLKKAESKESPIPDFRNLKDLSPFVSQELVIINYRLFNNKLNLHASTPVDAIVESCPGSIFQPPEA